MKLTNKHLFIIIIMYTLCFTLNAEESDWFNLDFNLLTGYRVDNLNWNIAGYNSSLQWVNVLSELTWSDLNIFELKLDVKAYIYNVALYGSLGYGFILLGENQDSDYDSDDREDEWSRSNNRCDNGNVIDIALGAGYRFIIGDDILYLTPLLGYALHCQNLRMTDGYLTIYTPNPALEGPFPGLDSQYNTYWNSIWAGGNVVLNIMPISVFLNIKGHWAFYYYAWADWNLRTDFQHPKSYEHVSGGFGFTISGGLNLKIAELWQINIQAHYYIWQAGKGIDRTFLATGGYSETTLNQVNWNSWGIMLGVVYSLK